MTTVGAVMANVVTFSFADIVNEMVIQPERILL